MNHPDHERRFSSRRDFFVELGALSLASFGLTPLGQGTVRGKTGPNEKWSAGKGDGDSPNDGRGGVLPPPPDPALLSPGVWGFGRTRGQLILVADEQLEALTDPDAEVNLSLTSEPNRTTLRKVCERAQAEGAETLILAFDEFWRLYRTDITGNGPRRLYPDSDRYIEIVAGISRFAADYGLGLELSLLSPLEIGKRFAETTGESGRWVQFREGARDPVSGRFSLSLWEHRRWTNNKGSILLDRGGIRVFAFREGDRFSADPFYPVAEEEIVELTGPFEIVSDDVGDDRPMIRTTISGSAKNESGRLPEGYNRVMAVVSYQTPEMDYFSPKARPFLDRLIQKYHDAGVQLNALYSDEIHIQQDWNYFGHHDAGQFTFRYLSDDFIRKFAEQYGEQYRDFEKYLVYFLVGQHDFLPTADAKEYSQHVTAPNDFGVHSTRLLRRRYYDLLDKTVIDLFAGAKREAETLYGRKLTARAHATWAQSPTIDQWRKQEMAAHYDYTPDFIWSNTVHQASAACDDYFRWNDFLTGGGNDFAEGGWSDRDYYGQAIAASTGSLNDTPNAYACAWGMPEEARRRHVAIEAAFGNDAFPEMKSVENGEHRSADVLMLYPIVLAPCEERFGSWMTQYGYANYITAEKLLEFGRIAGDGTVWVRDRPYRTLAALYEPLPFAGLLEFLDRFLASGGRVVWSGPPAKLDMGGNPVFEAWRKIFGIETLNAGMVGIAYPGRRVEFEGILAGMEPMTVLTDFPVDYLFPLVPAEEAGVEITARCDGQPVGVKRGNALYLGFRPRDDQSASLGYETRVWFETLNRIGAYPASRPGAEDHPTVVSRTSPYLATRFPNGALAVTNHYSRHRESWGGGFHRNEAKDAKTLKANPLPTDRLTLDSFPLAGHVIDYHGDYLVAFRLDDRDRLTAFYGVGSQEITLNGKTHRFADRPMTRVAWAPVADARRIQGGAVLEIWTTGEAATVSIPWTETDANGRLRPKKSVGNEADRGTNSPRLRLFRRRGADHCGDEIPMTFTDGLLQFDVPAGSAAFFLTRTDA